ncbi:FAD-dependent monooxygenase [Plantactinospora sp. S1510]|uniref:FAD-dependent monooxygenase n=1 Tax=Plantactinospora alkalitolerans TaxID=2789879 RepID=A0ABS0H0K5_9ACTN|nr:NAD(P)/FAD-dependent oxidoreductase [Plantactinospora alkalitolerans]MBF9131991.1 FAD-dependent monooxygenase [Plantactinospora alkalitolerans]
MPETPPFRVLIIGAGIGGLALAHGLRRAGVPVAVYERDRSRTDRPQGYRLHINPAGSQALRECLAPDLFETFVSTCGANPSTMTFYTEQLDRLLTVDVEPGKGHRSVSRHILRQVLLTGLAGVVQFGKTYHHYRQAPDGTLTACFVDGTSVEGDLLIGADGGGSPVRRQYLPHARRVDTGVRGIAGRVPITAATRALVPARVFDGPAVVNAPGGLGVFVAAQQFQRPPEGLELDPVEDFISWGLGAKRAKLPTGAELSGLDGPALRTLVLEVIRSWHPHLRELVASTDPDAITATTIRSAEPVPPWPASPITLLGDAIHSMTPARGVGANTALRDAALLTRTLGAARRGELSPTEAIGRYEAEMIRYGFDAVRASLRDLRQQTSIEGRVALAMARAGLRVLDAVPPLKRRAFADLGG